MAKSKGAIAAGHRDTARAGADVLEAGGNSVDAAVAAAFAACVAEPCLIALGCGGFMLVHDAKSGKQTMLDYFVAMPGKGLDESQRKTAQLVPTPVDFGGATQMFHSGHASVGVPGFVAGLFEAHDRFGSLPMKELVGPAKELAKRGAVQNEQQAFLIEILYGILSLSEDSKKLYSNPDGTRIGPGQTVYHPDIIGTLDELAAGGADSLYRGDLAKAFLKEMDAGGGYVTEQDLAEYEVMTREPVRAEYRGRGIVTNPPPSSGGALIAHTLRLLSHFDLKVLGWQSFAHLRHLTEAMSQTAEVRKARFDQNVHDEDVLERLLAEKSLAEDHGQMTNRLGNTTHISVIDGQGNAVTTTNSNGANSGIAVPGTGIMLNSMLGEEDLNPGGFHQHPVGSRIPSMMSPTLVLANGKPELALGSAGSNRIRSAVLQVISAVLDFEQSIQEAVEAPRVHFENGQLGLEGGIPEAIAKRLTTEGYNVNLWKEKNPFFGGAHAVGLEGEKLAGHGDSRRGGAAIVL